MTTGAVEARKSPLRSPLLQRGEARSARGICARGNVWNVYSVRDLTAIYRWVDGCRAQECHGQASCPCPTSSAGGPAQCCPGNFPSSGSGLVLLPFGVREPRSRFCQAKPRFACSRPEAWLQANKAPAWRFCWRMFSSSPERTKIPPRYARPPLVKGAFGSPPLTKGGQGGFRQQYRMAGALHNCASVAQRSKFIPDSIGTSRQWHPPHRHVRTLLPARTRKGKLL
jgi:hypothetical protein